jgi:hypothetical protein
VKNLAQIKFESAKIIYYKDKIKIIFEKEINIFLLYFLYEFYFIKENEIGNFYTVKKDENYLIQIRVVKKLKDRAIDVETFISNMYESEKTNHRDSGDGFIGEIMGLEIRYKKDIIKDIDVSKELIRITREYGIFMKKKLNT